MALVGHTGDSLAGLKDRAAQIAALVVSIAGSSEEQSSGLSEVNAAVNNMDKVTQQNAAMVEQTSAAAAQLGLRSIELVTAVSRFHLGENRAREERLDIERPASPVRRAAEAGRPAPTAGPAQMMQKTLKAAVGGAGWEEF